MTGISGKTEGGGGGERWPWGRWGMFRNVDVGGGGKRGPLRRRRGGAVFRRRLEAAAAAAAGRLHAGDTRPRQGEAAASVAGTAAAREGAVAVAVA